MNQSITIALFICLMMMILTICFFIMSYINYTCCNERHIKKNDIKKNIIHDDSDIVI